VSLFLKKLKYHNFFFKFIKTALTIFISDKSISSKIKGIKLKIKGRLNKAPRAKSKIITIGNLPVFTIDSTIDYAETTAYSANGTLGVKVWICYN
jgi:ribosomal protein S3